MKGTHLGEFEELVLLVVVILNDDAYVLRIQEELKKQVNRSVSMGALHTTLSRLESKGLLDSEMSGASAKRGGRRKRVYQVNALGSQALRDAKALRSQLWEQVPEYALKLQHG